MRKKYLSKFTSIALSLLMAISMLPQIAFATPGPTIWDGSSDTSWYHDTDTSFTITTAKELAGLAELVNGGNNFSGKTITLGADIQLNDTSGWESWDSTPADNTWTPIGTISAPFKGTFDGAGNTVSGIYINNSAASNPIGLFGYAYDHATIQNVGVTSSYIEGGTYVGGIVGSLAGDIMSSEGPTIASCYNEGTIVGTQQVGGVVGALSYRGKLVNCLNSGAVSSSGNMVGGLAGNGYSSTQIINCSNTGSVTSAGDDVGGVAGRSYSSAEVMNCYNTGAVSSSGNNVGGVVGHNEQPGNKVNNCYNAGAVSGGSVVGGIIGNNEQYNTVKYCYWLFGVDAVGTEWAASNSFSFSGSDTTWTLANDAEYSVTPASKSNTVTISINASLVDALNAWADTSDYNSWKVDSALSNSGYPIYAQALTGTASISGDAVYGATLKASLTSSNNSGTLSYHWIRTNWSGDTVIDGATGNTYTLTADDLYYTVSVKITSSEEGGSITSAATASVQKADCTTTDIVAPITSEVTSSSITVEAVDGYQYACVKSGVTSLSDWWKNSNVFTGLSSNTPYDIYQRIPQTATHKASNPSAKLTVTTGLSDNWIDYVSEPTLDGTTYTITSASELSWIAKQVQDGMNFEDFTFELTSDIGLSDHFWIAIGGGKTPFSGTFNGNGHTISNLKMDASTQMFCGLFGLSDGTLKNILLDGVNISGDIDNESYIGALCGASMETITDGLVSNGTISVNGLDEAEIYAGIVCGYHMGSIDSYGANGTVTINGNANGSHAGGLVGNIEGASIYNSYANVSVTGDDGSITGGLVGFAYGGNIENCVSYGNASVPSNASTTYLGGLIGNNSSDEPCTVSNSYWNTSATQSYCGAARTSDEILGIGNHTPETDAADTSCSGKTLAELKSEAFLNTLNDYVSTKNAEGVLSDPLQLWKRVTSNDDFPGFIEVKSTNPDTTNPVTTNPNTPDGGSSHTSSGGGSGNVRVPVESPVEVNGQKQDAGTVTIQNSGGQTVTTIKVDDTKLDQLLASSGEKPTVTLPMNKASDVVVGELSGQTVKNMEQKAAVLEIKTESVSYSLPAAQINIDDVSSQIGEQVALKDIQVSVKIAEPSADTVKIVEKTAVKNSYQIVVKPVEFEITCTSGEKTVEVSKFNGYVERTVAIPDGIDPAKITTGIVLNNDGTFSHVPTQIVVVNGQYYAKINSLTNSTYSVIYNPVTFTDVENHWAKDAINDMGSRMVVAGTGSSTYEPDRSITRAEFAAIVVRALGLRQGTEDSSFGDVSLTDWFNGYVDTATEYALITGYEDGSFCPSNTITREQAMAIIARAMKLTGDNVSLTDSEVGTILSRYTDKTNVSGYAKESVAACLKTGIVTGKTATTISSKDYVTRAEVAVLVQRLLQKSGLI